jgi:hypothetical protein
MERVFIPSKIGDNQLLAQNDPFYIARLRQSGSEALVRAWLEGNWDLVDGAFFDSWSDKNVLATSDWLRRIPVYALRFRSFDWGYARPFSCGWYAVSDGTWGLPEGALVKYREWYGSTGKPNEGLRMNADLVAKGIRSRERLENYDPASMAEYPWVADPVSYGVADPSIFTRDGGPSIMEAMSEHVSWRRADNKRVPGWQAMRQRITGTNGVPMLYFLDCCDDSIRTIPIAQVDETDPEDLDTEGEDHACDETRYACMARPWVEHKPEDVHTLHFPKNPNEMTIDELIERNRSRRLLAEQDAA